MAANLVRGSRGYAWKGASLLTEAMKAFFVSDGSADRDLVNDKETLLYRSRALFQNNAFSSALISSIDVNVVGTGIHAFPVPNFELLGLNQNESENWSRKTQELFDIWADSKKCDVERKKDFYQLQDLGVKTHAVTGEVFALPRYDFKNPFGLKVKLLEGDRCQNPFGVVDSDRCCMGVEVDEDGAPLNYYFTKKPVNGIDNVGGIVETVRVPAFDALGNQNVIHAFTTDRTDQRRGVPLLAPVVSQLKQQERYQDAELLAAVVSAMFTAFIISPNNAPADFLGNVDGDERVTRSDCELRPGGIATLAAGEDIKFADPKRPNASYAPFVDGIFAEVAASRGLSAEQVMRRFNSSYNAVRAAIMESRKTYEKMKYDFVADFCQPIYEKFLAGCVATGIVKADGYFTDPIKNLLWNSCMWVSDSGFMLDPQKETDALIKQLDNHLVDRDTVCRKIGGVSYLEVAKRLADERKIRARLGLGEPGTVNKTESVSIQETSDGESGNGENEDETN